MCKAFSGLSTFKTLLCVVAALTALPFSHAQNPGPVRIGVLAPITGPLATPGAEMIDALKMFWDKNNNTVSGRKVELVIADTTCNPDQALTQARRLRSEEHTSELQSH